MTNQGNCDGLFTDKQSEVFHATQHGSTVPGEFFRNGEAPRLQEQLWEYFEVRFRAEKYGVPYFLAESEAKQSDARKEAAGARARNAVEDLNVVVRRHDRGELS
jgi:hypothetical protein